MDSQAVGVDSQAVGVGSRVAGVDIPVAGVGSRGPLEEEYSDEVLGQVGGPVERLGGSNVADLLVVPHGPPR